MFLESSLCNQSKKGKSVIQQVLEEKGVKETFEYWAISFLLDLLYRLFLGQSNATILNIICIYKAFAALCV